MHLCYQNNEYLIEGGLGHRGRSGRYLIICAGPFWDGTKPSFVLNPSTCLPWIYNEVLDQIIHLRREEENIWISYAMNDYKDLRGCAVRMQRATTSRECKNQKIIRFAVRLVAIGVLESLELACLPFQNGAHP